uniref:carbohydrate-binding domain-containing protein n=1 Tax=Methylobacterium crusticola TaxID=1697972 RepID=UPI0023EAE7C9
RDVDLSTIGIKTAEGMALAKAYQNYGGYVTDTAGPNTINMAYVETGATNQQINNLHTDMQAIRDHIQLVTDNTAATPGGGGTPIVSTPAPTPVVTAPTPVATDPAPTPVVTAPTPVATDPAPATPAAPAGTPAATLGSGSHELLLKISQDSYRGDATYTVSVDGQQVGGTQTAHASHAAGQSDLISVRGDWGAGTHDVSVTFLNDTYAGSAAKDRNLYVDGATYDGKAVSGGQAGLWSNGSHHFSIGDAAPATAAPAAPAATPPTATPAAAAATLGSGPDVLLLKISQDSYRGDATYTVSVDGKQVGGTQTAHASHAAGQSDLISVRGTWAAGDHDVAVKFLNDAYDGSAAKDRNLYVDGATYTDGASHASYAVQGAEQGLWSNGTHHFTFHDYLV